MNILREILRPKNIGITIDGQPDIHVHNNAIYVPKTTNFDENQGLYTCTGFLIQEAALYGHNPPQLKGHSHYIKININSDFPEINEAIYIGHADLHYGHTITEFCNRLWALPQIRKNNEKLLLHSFHSFSKIFSTTWFCDLIKLFDLNENDFLLFDTPTKIKRLIVPSPAFCEENFVFSQFNKYAQLVGRDVIQNQSTKFPELIYISREKMKSGSWLLSNEASISEALASTGFRIVFPEELSMRDQITMFSPGNVIVGLLGSACHTSIFGYGAKSIILSAGPPSKNYFLMDYFGGSQMQYFNFDVVKEDDKAGFFSNFRSSEPEKLAEEIIIYCTQLLRDSINL